VILPSPGRRKSMAIVVGDPEEAGQAEFSPSSGRRKSIQHKAEEVDPRRSIRHANTVSVGSTDGARLLCLGKPSSLASLAMQQASRESLKQPSVDSRILGSACSSPRASQSLKGPLPEMFSLSSSASAWVPVELDSFGQPVKPSSRSLHMLEDKKMLAELSQTMAGQLNEMYAFMNQAMTQERSRHSSDVSLILRKVEEDLRHTFDNVRNTFATLTDQLVRLAKEVEVGRNQVTNVQNKHLRTKEAVEAQAQYVTELEAALDNQQSGVSGKLKQMSTEAQDARVALKKLEETSAQREKALKEEIAMMRKSLLKYESPERNSNALPPPLQEMPATWTKAASEDAGGEGGSEIMKSVMMHCDSDRQVPRLKKAVRAKPSRLPSLPAQEPPTPSLQKGTDQRISIAEARCARMHRFVSKAYPPLCLLSDIFAVLRASGCFGGVVSLGEDGLHVTIPEDFDAHDILSRIARLTCNAAPKLRGLSDLLVAVGGEVRRPPPECFDPKVMAKVAEEPTSFDAKRAKEEENRLMRSFHQPSTSLGALGGADLQEGLMGLASRAANEGFPKPMSSPAKRPAMQIFESFAEDEEEEDAAW